MKGIVAKSLLVGFLLVSSVAAQNSSFPVPDQDYLTLRALSLLNYYPLTRDFNGGGARAKGMGNAFIGVSDDVTGVTWNPAGLYRPNDQYSQPVLGLGYKSMSSKSDFRDQMYFDLPWHDAKVNDVFSGVDFMSLVVPIRIKGHVFVGSMAYSRLDDEFRNSSMALNVEIPFDYYDYTTNTLRPFSYLNNTIYRSWVNAYNFGFGTRVYRNVSFGLSVNAYGGGASQSMREVVGWDGLIVPGLQGSQRALVKVRNLLDDTTSYSGVYLTLGLKLNAERFSAGLILKTPHVLKEMTDYVTTTQVTANGYQMSGSLVTRHNDNQLIEIDQPMVLGAGAAYKAKDNWIVAGDIEYRAYGGGKINRRDSLQLVPGGTNVEFFTEVDPHWKNVLVLRGGTEYVWNTGKVLFPTVPLRAGLGYIQVPEPDITGFKTRVENGVEVLDGLKYSKASMMRWSLGAGIYWSQIHLDLSYGTYSFERNNTVVRQKSSVDNGVFDLTFTGFF